MIGFGLTGKPASVCSNLEKLFGRGPEIDEISYLLKLTEHHWQNKVDTEINILSTTSCSAKFTSSLIDRTCF